MGEIRKCLYCGREFEVKSYGHRQLYCSEDCRIKAKHNRYKKNYIPKGKGHEAICYICGKSFIAYTTGKYCSDECKKKAARKNNCGHNAPHIKREKKELEKEPRTEEKTVSTNKKLLSTGRDLWSVAKAAFEHGMSYGKYVEMLEHGG